MPCAATNPKNSGAIISAPMPGLPGRIHPKKLILVVPWSMMAVIICMPSGEKKQISGATISPRTAGVQEMTLPKIPTLEQI